MIGLDRLKTCDLGMLFKGRPTTLGINESDVGPVLSLKRNKKMTC